VAESNPLLSSAGVLARSARKELGQFIGQAVGSAVDRVVVDHHARRLRKVGWGHALDAPAGGWAEGGTPPRAGNSVEVLIDGAEFLPLAAEELARAESHVHIAGWYFSPELALTRTEDPVTLRNLLAELAERIPVRVLIWSGAPVRVFSPTRGDVRAMVEKFCRGTKIDCRFDNCVRFWHCHHEKTIVVDDRVAFVGGIDLTYDGGDPYDGPEHKARGGVGWHDLATCLRGPIVADVAQHFRLRWQGSTEEELPPTLVQEPAGDLKAQIVRTVPEQIYNRSLPRGDFSVLESYVRGIRSAQEFIYIENQFLWSAEIVALLVEKLRSPPRDDFRLVVLLPVNANDGADVSRGQVASLINADDDNDRFLACSVYARTRTLRDPIYVHAKVAIVDDRWFTVGSTNLNEHSLFNDSEMNVVVHDEELIRNTRLRLWSEHLELPIDAIRHEAPAETVDRHWKPIAEEQLERLRNDQYLTHRLVKLPGVSVKHRRIIGALEGRLYDA
jgi:phosphatidylserine/phosphatidylglycerophosphate/cardiolipin synthase-like enzyme